MQSGPEQLRDWMRRRGFTQADTARYLEEPKFLICKVLSGSYRLGLNKALKFERHTGIPVEAWASVVDDVVETVPPESGKRSVAK